MNLIVIFTIIKYLLDENSVYRTRKVLQCLFKAVLLPAVCENAYDQISRYARIEQKKKIIQTNK